MAAARQPSSPPPAQKQQVITQQQSWTGPLPPPAALEHFNQIIPDGAQRIMQMVEQEQAHRLSQDKTALNAEIADTRRGHWIGGLVSVGAIAASIYTASIGAHATVSIALVGLPIAIIVQSFLKRK